MGGEKLHLFGEYVLDAARGRLLRAGRPVHLRPQAYRALKYLAENRGRLVSKDRLIEEVWEGRAVTDDSLVQCLRDVRHALGEGGTHYLRNERGRGYIFDPDAGALNKVENGTVWTEQVDLVRVVVEDEEETGPAGGSDPPASRTAILTAGTAAVGATAEARAAHTASSAEYLVGKIKRHRHASIIALALIALAAAGVVYFTRFAPGGQSIRSVAVLPFANSSGDPDLEYLSDGLGESLINSLSKVPGLKVIARTSAFRYKGKEADPPEVARSLGVDAVLTGRVAQRGESLLIGVELVDTRDNTQVWGEQYNRRATDLLQVQSEISGEVAAKLRLHLTAGEEQQLARRENVNPQAYEMLLKGRFYRGKGGTENQKKAIEYFKQAVAVDPNYALAYAELSIIYADLVTASVLDPKEYMPKAEDAAHKALELDESLAEAHLALSGVKLIAWDWAAAEREVERAVELNPNLAAARRRHAFYLNIMGRHDEAVAEGRRARELDPLSLNIYWLLMARQYDQALEAAKKALEMNSNNASVHVQLGHAHGMKEQYPEAVAAYQEGIKLGDDSPDTQIALGIAYAKGGEREKAWVILRRLEARREYVSPGTLADLYVALGERERALASLERAYAEHDNQLQFLAVNPQFDPLRDDPRFQDLVRRVGLPQ